MKRMKFTVHCPMLGVARFSELWMARLFAITLSREMPSHVIEMSEASGLIGQYKDGRTTPEFKQHHIDGIFR